MEPEDDETVTTETVETPVGRIVYEQDVRAGARSNGWASDLLGAEEVAAGGSDVPPELPDEPEYHRHGPEKRSPILMYGLAFTYLAFGTLGVWVGVTMLRDLRSGKEQKK
jgi:hypothetical protein